jgi:hypothetical protein
MTYRKYGAFIAPLSGLALILASNATLAASSAARGSVQAFAAHPMFRPSIGRSFRHHRGLNVGAFWPGEGDWIDSSSYGQPGYGQPGVDAAPPPTSGDVHYTYTYDVPWDQIHRFPPNVTPSARPYVPDCTAQTVTVPKREGTEQTANINIIRCY